MNKLTLLWSEYKSLKKQRRYYEADQIKHKIKLLKNQQKNGRQDNTK